MTDELVFYHRTSIGQARTIAKSGFSDEKWGFEVRDQASGRPIQVVGVWFSDRPLSSEEGPDGDAVLEVKVALSEEALHAFELEGIFWNARLWVVPAAIINPHVSVRILEVDPRTSWWHEAPGDVSGDDDDE